MRSFLINQHFLKISLNLLLLSCTNKINDSYYITSSVEVIILLTLLTLLQLCHYHISPQGSDLSFKWCHRARLFGSPSWLQNNSESSSSLPLHFSEQQTTFCRVFHEIQWHTTDPGPAQAKYQVFPTSSPSDIQYLGVSLYDLKQTLLVFLLHYVKK